MPAIYQADVFCDNCADEIRSRLLDAATDEQGDEWQDEAAYDSGEFPKYMSDDEEADCPQHCGSGEDCLEAEVLPSGRKIGALLSTSLTGDGADYVLAAVAEGGEVAQFWRSRFDWIDYPNEDQE